ncbi:MAG TPA: tripartite tricarboxylate transporter TctB family protein [Aurantimonas sp.]|uniref:Tripartite tricarboxylate transporter TctB family protein n=1 Tax=Aurantimonas marianensis TaxID=2920428 RepID=A0A9X2H8L7_9HYPH|nr:tripartite tricarboxylate transporter TctB family protein [Aurantimonas marianensis]MCP3055263.1 tripartite tricarboxylate transporter TctB family protein [Aurantimonas marianensis]
MSEKMRDVVTGTLLLVLASVWMLIVWRTIPPGTGGGDVGPRAFPLLLGAFLALFSLWLTVAALRKRGDSAGALEADVSADDARAEKQGGGGDLAAPILTVAHLLAYGFLMQRIGFVLATFVVVASIMLFCTSDRSPLRIGAMSLGVTFACWLIFGKILGVYLATGSWINLG